MGRNYKGISINTTTNTHEKVFDLVDKNLDKVIVDIPSGSGAFVLRLKDAGYRKVKAFDIENIMQITHDDFVVGDMTKKFPFEDNACDIIVCIDGIEHISKQYDFIQESQRVLKKNGEIIISTPNISSIRSRFKWLTTGHHHKCGSPLDEENPNYLHHIAMISFHEMRYLLHANGFRLTDVTTNRIKIISWLYIFFVPFIYLSTFWVYKRTGKRNKTSKINGEVIKTMFSIPILFGETLIVKAVKTGSTKTYPERV